MALGEMIEEEIDQCMLNNERKEAILELEEGKLFTASQQE